MPLSSHSNTNFQPSPFQVQTPEFSSSPLDQIGNSLQAGPSSRGALVQRAFTLTRKSSVKRPTNVQQPSSSERHVQQDYINVKPNYSRNTNNDFQQAIGIGGDSSAYTSLQRPPEGRVFTDGLRNAQVQHNSFEGSSTAGEWRKEKYQYPRSEGQLLDQGHRGTVQDSQPDGVRTESRTPLIPTSSTSIERNEQSRNSISDQVQKQRAARLSQQQFDLDEYNRKRESQMTIRSPALQSNQNDSFVGQGQSNASLSNAFRDSLASNISFNSITGTEERSSMMLLNQNYFGGGEENKFRPIDVEEFANDTDRIAQEVRGLTMRRRPSLDTVRSSEFGEGGRWAKAWAGSEDGEEDEEEDEFDLQAMRAREMSDFDIESKNSQTGLGALGELGNLQGIRAAMNGNGLERDIKASSLDQRNVLNSSQAHNLNFPQLQDVTGALHTVSLTSSHKPSLRSNGPPVGSSSHLHSYLPTRSELSRRDTVLSVAGEIGEVGDAEPNQSHARKDSNATVSTMQDLQSDVDNNQHVKIWPPTPAASEVSSSNHHVRVGRSDTLRAAPAIGLGQSAKVEFMEEHNDHTQKQKIPNKPINPSTLLSQNQQSSVYRPAPTMSDGKPFLGYADPNQHSFYAPPETFGKARQKAIADHDGRESMVSDLDVETLRLDGSSVAGGSRDEWDSRRGSTSTLGTVDSDILEEQRRRRSRMEYQEAQSYYTNVNEGEVDRRASSSTIRVGNDARHYTQGLNENATRHPSQASLRHSAANIDSSSLKRIVSHPIPSAEVNNGLNPSAPIPRRSNTLPDEQQLSNQNKPSLGVYKQQTSYTPNLAPAPWARSNANQPSFAQQANGYQTLSPSMRSTTLSTTNTPNGKSNSTMNSSKRTSGPTPIVQSEAEKFLTLGISHHESGDLSRSAFYFERSAKIEGGCVVGMCMWGMALREGWGIRKDQKRGFEWISRAASKAGDLMSTTNANGAGGVGGAAAAKVRTEAELKAIRSELKLSVYELGKCFCYGWGVKQDRQMALEYFELAAKLGDSDAQAEAGALLAAGKGCKKDLKKAAMYYRMAEAQGYDTVGLSWIHKDKYDPVSPTSTKAKHGK